MTWRRAAVALSIAALGLTGCGDDGEPESTPTPSASVTSSGSESPSASSSTGSATPTTSASGSPSANASVPAAARARTEAGAIAFLNFFYDEVNRGQTDPGSVNLFDYSDPGCIACKNLQGALQDFVDNGWSTRQKPVRLRSAGLANEVTADRVIINFTFEQLPVDYYKNGASAGKLDAATTKHAAAVRWTGGAWQMYDVEEL